MIDELRKLDDYDVPAALDVELSLFTAALALYVDLKAQEQLSAKLHALEKARRDAAQKEAPAVTVSAYRKPPGSFRRISRANRCAATRMP
ncbi:hypothetical protein [Pseudomonas soli]|uniref:hypothetical protein n=1 Tax=Pseudomonas soli TaxID=1306993 RepID=UPI003DAA2DC4